MQCHGNLPGSQINGNPLRFTVRPMHMAIGERSKRNDSTSPRHGEHIPMLLSASCGPPPVSKVNVSDAVRLIRSSSHFGTPCLISASSEYIGRPAPLSLIYSILNVYSFLSEAVEDGAAKQTCCWSSFTYGTHPRGGALPTPLLTVAGVPKMRSFVGLCTETNLK